MPALRDDLAFNFDLVTWNFCSLSTEYHVSNSVRNLSEIEQSRC